METDDMDNETKTETDDMENEKAEPEQNLQTTYIYVVCD